MSAGDQDYHAGAGYSQLEAAQQEGPLYYHYPTRSAIISNTCLENVHYFKCKHEPKCECGLTERIAELALDDGI